MEKLEFVVNSIKNFGVQTRIYSEPLSALETYDNGLRSRLFQTFDIGPLKDFIRSIKPENMYLTEDLYGCHYCFFCLNSLNSEIVDRGGGGG
jgi:hypothetical protein